jgi:hypothetical protein
MMQTSSTCPNETTSAPALPKLYRLLALEIPVLDLQANRDFQPGPPRKTLSIFRNYVLKPKYDGTAQPESEVMVGF